MEVIGGAFAGMTTVMIFVPFYLTFFKLHACEHCILHVEHCFWFWLQIMFFDFRSVIMVIIALASDVTIALYYRKSEQ